MTRLATPREMALKAVLASQEELDALPEPLRALYLEKDGKWRLDAETVDYDEALTRAIEAELPARLIQSVLYQAENVCVTVNAGPNSVSTRISCQRACRDISIGQALRYAEILMLRRAGRPFKTIAARFNISVPAIRQAYARAVRWELPAPIQISCSR